MPGVMGLETEFGLALAPAGAMARCYEVTRALCDAHGLLRCGGFLANGARLYPDCGHVEYATPEGVDPLAVLTADRAGELIVASLTEGARARLDEMGVHSVRHLKHNVDSAGTTFGCHENYQVTSNISRGHVATQLAAFLITRSAWAGAGRVVDGRFRTSQRAGFLEKVAGYNSTIERPLMNLRDEPLANHEKWQRVHLLAGDANMADVPAFTKLVSTCLVLRCLELGEAPDSALGPRDVASTHVAVAEDLTGREPVQWTRGEYHSPLDVQFQWLERVGAMLEREGGKDWELHGFQLWREMLEALEAKGPAGLVGTAEWATKYELLDKVAERSELGWRDPKVEYADMHWHDVDPRTGLARRLEAAGSLRRLTDPTAVEAARTTSPCAGRSRQRARFIELCAAAGVRGSANWERVWFTNHPQLHLDDPTCEDLRVVEQWVHRHLAQVATPPPPPPHPLPMPRLPGAPAGDQAAV